MNRTSRYPMRRILVFAVVMVVLVGVFVVKLVDIQIVRASALNVQAQDARSVPVTVYGARGDIVDANGTGARRHRHALRHRALAEAGDRRAR